MHTCWKLLGISETEDTKTIKRAYAKRLKSIDPDKEIEAFQELRAAYQDCLGFSKGLLRPERPPENIVISENFKTENLPDSTPPVEASDEISQAEAIFVQLSDRLDHLFAALEENDQNRAISIYEQVLESDLFEAVGIRDRFFVSLFYKLVYTQWAFVPYALCIQFKEDFDLLKDANFYNEHAWEAFVLDEYISDLIYYEEFFKSKKEHKDTAKALELLLSDLDTIRNKKIASRSLMLNNIKEILFQIEDERPALFERLFKSPNIDWWRKRVLTPVFRLRYLWGALFAYFCVAPLLLLLFDVDIDMGNNLYWGATIIGGPLALWLVDYFRTVFRYHYFSLFKGSLHEFRRRHPIIRISAFAGAVATTTASFIIPSNCWWIATFGLLALSLDLEIFIGIAFTGFFSQCFAIPALDNILPKTTSFFSHTSVCTLTVVIWFFIIALILNIPPFKYISAKFQPAIFILGAIILNSSMFYGLLWATGPIADLLK